MTDLPFVKAQGAGNDFIILDEGSTQVNKLSALVPQLCDRHFGIGADGVLWISHSGPNRGRVVFYNSDGSRAEICGNGLRCAAHYLAWRYDGSDEQIVETDLGPRRCVRVSDKNSPGQSWQVEMELIVVSPDNVDNKQLSGGVKIGAQTVTALAASAGNPHLVLRQSGDAATLASHGPTLSKHPAFAHGCNVEWVSPKSDHVYQVEVFERGVGRTLACGSGACAVAASLIAWGDESAKQSIAIDMPGGRLHVKLDKQGRALLSGPSQMVFSGTWSVETAK